MPDIVELLDHRFLDNTVRQWAVAATAFLITFAVRPAVAGYARRLANRRELTSGLGARELLLRIIGRTHPLFLWVLAAYVAMRFLRLPDELASIVGVAVTIGLWLQAGLWATAALECVLDARVKRHGTADRALASSLGLIRFLALASVWVLASLLALDNLGVNVTALIAGLGIVGLATALALKTLLSDIFSALAIALDEPFAIGDSIAIGKLRGKVEDLGLKSTRLRSIDGELIVMSNTDILESRLRNFGRMKERRGVLTVGVSYETPVAKLREAAQIIEAAIREQAGVRFDRCHLAQLGRDAVTFEAVFQVESPEFAAMVAAQTAIHQRVDAAFVHEGIAFAYPTQKAHLAVVHPQGAGRILPCAVDVPTSSVTEPKP